MWRLIKLFFWIYFSKEAQAIRKACEYSTEKVSKDGAVTKNHMKREEAYEWAFHYMREFGGSATESQVRFMIELIIQLNKLGGKKYVNMETTA